MVQNDPEEWIQLWVVEQGRVGHHGKINYQGMNHRYNDEPINGGHRLGMIRINGTNESMDDWLLLDTEGDGTCMIHAFLLELSPTYRGLQPRQRSQAGRAYRLYLHRRLSVTRHGCSDESLEDMRQLGIFLQDDVLSVLSHFFNIGLIYMSCSQYGAELSLVREARGRPYVMIANIEGAHYEALVRRRGRFMEQQPEADALAVAVQAIQPLLFARRMEREAQDPTSEQALRLRQMIHDAAASGAINVGAGVGAASVEKPAHVTTWSCPACTTVNPSSTNDCQLCRYNMLSGGATATMSSRPFLPSLPSPRSQKLIDDLSRNSSSVLPWNCPRCTTINPASSSVCQTCGYKMVLVSGNGAVPLPSPRSQKIIDDLSKTWNCPRCTTINPVSMVHCQSCGYDRTSSASSSSSGFPLSSKKDSHPDALCRCIAPSTGNPCRNAKIHGQRYCSIHMKKCERSMEGRKHNRSRLTLKRKRRLTQRSKRRSH